MLVFCALTSFLLQGAMISILSNTLDRVSGQPLSDLSAHTREPLADSLLLHKVMEHAKDEYLYTVSWLRPTVVAIQSGADGEAQYSVYVLEVVVLEVGLNFHANVGRLRHPIV